MKKIIQNIIFKIPYLGTIYRDYKVYKTNFPPGHYSNPFPSLEEVNKYSSKLFDSSVNEIKGINLNYSKQLELLHQLKDEYSNIPYVTGAENFRYYFDNPMFQYSDGIFLWLMIDWIKPKNIIEVGSGFSSILMLDINEHKCQNNIHLTFIEPFPTRLNENLKTSDYTNVQIHKKPIQEIELSVFSKLQENDILFLDTTHICKTASDLNYDIFDILPSLSKGVYVHIHDIFFPFEYPKEWVLQQKGYNERHVSPIRYLVSL